MREEVEFRLLCLTWPPELGFLEGVFLEALVLQYVSMLGRAPPRPGWGPSFVAPVGSCSCSSVKRFQTGFVVVVEPPEKGEPRCSTPPGKILYLPCPVLLEGLLVLVGPVDLAVPAVVFRSCVSSKFVYIVET